MKKLMLNFGLLVGTVGAVLYLCVMAQHEHGSFGHSLGPGGLLLWPGIILSRAGPMHTWIFLLLGALVLAGIVARLIKRRHWLLAPALGLVLALGYCSLGSLVFKVVTVPFPTATPYDTEPEKRQQYLEAYGEGYRTGLAGRMRTCCFAPAQTSKGFYEGLATGLAVYYRALGVRNENGLTDISAARDGVGLDSSSSRTSR